jgi:hypothetical protein
MGSEEIKSNAATATATQATTDNKPDVSQVERTISHDDLQKDHMDFERVDPDVAKYATHGQLEISPEENKRLKKLIDRRVLSIMIFTYVSLIIQVSPY